MKNQGTGSTENRCSDASPGPNQFLTRKCYSMIVERSRRMNVMGEDQITETMKRMEIMKKKERRRRSRRRTRRSWSYCLQVRGTFTELQGFDTMLSCPDWSTILARCNSVARPRYSQTIPLTRQFSQVRFLRVSSAVPYASNGQPYGRVVSCAFIFIFC